ncbi:MAG TPA: L-histidine N(alpha)-methyltransferase [Hyphomicrobiaceae bacterium]|nr:L-histidine N(alpha)-methyltransferase [Hyphomicrobiaceae bacterium]
MTRHEKEIIARHGASKAVRAFAEAVFTGLSAPHKHLPCQYFYDARGSALFEEITELEEYYLTRTETGILTKHAAEMAKPLGAGAALIEFGSGSSRKTELLLGAMDKPGVYVPVDVSQSALNGAGHRLAKRFPGLNVLPERADFSTLTKLPAAVSGRRRAGFFPGSTIGNFDPRGAVSLLAHFARVLGPGARLIVGVDLDKDPQRLLAAYNDARGVTARFNLNLLERINRELAGSFDLSSFRHVALYNQDAKRIEMHIVSLRDQTVDVLGQPFEFAAGESIHTENSCKYSVEGFRGLAREAGWDPARVWKDAAGDFSVHELVAPPADST